VSGVRQELWDYWLITVRWTTNHIRAHMDWGKALDRNGNINDESNYFQMAVTNKLTTRVEPFEVVPGVVTQVGAMQK
jgi:hypothetical protein